MQNADNKDGIELARILIAAKANLDLKDHPGETALMRAVLHDNVEMVRLLVESGANLGLRDGNGETARNRAIRLGRKECEKILSAPPPSAPK